MHGGPMSIRFFQSTNERIEQMNKKWRRHGFVAIFRTSPKIGMALRIAALKRVIESWQQGKRSNRLRYDNDDNVR
jgi:hypothetical protein